MHSLAPRYARPAAAITLLFAFAWLPFHGIFRVAETFLFLALIFLALHSCTREITQDTVFRMAVAMLCILVLGLAWQQLTLPEDMSPSFKMTRHYLKPFLLLPIAYIILVTHHRLSWWIPMAATLGMATHLLTNTSPAEWSAAWSGTRTSFGIINAQHTGVFFATFLLAGIAFTPRATMSTPDKWRPLAFALMLGMVAFSMWGTIITQVRAVWLALIMTAMCLPLIAFLTPRRIRNQASTKQNGLPYTASALVVALATGITFGTTNGVIQSRLSQENITTENLAAASALEDHVRTSSTVRIASWVAAIEWIGEKPILGWSGSGARNLIQKSTHFDDHFKSRFGHLHNSYLETLVSIGLAGFMMLFALSAYIGVRFLKGVTRGQIPRDAAYFYLAFFVFFSIVNIFESYIIFKSGQYIIPLVGGMAYYQVLRIKASPGIPNE